MEAPSRFVELLNQTFDGRLRIRWSVSQQEFHIEQKVGHGFASCVCPIDEADDNLVRANDGYHFIMAVRGGDRMPCPQCGMELKVPVRETWDMACPYCQLRGKTTRIVVGYWPLTDVLIEHLRKIDPLRDDQAVVAEQADFNNRLLLESQVNDTVNPADAEFEQHYRRLVGIPQTGYTGREFRGNE